MFHCQDCYLQPFLDATLNQNLKSDGCMPPRKYNGSLYMNVTD